jgi:hypothetical protein
LVEGNIGCLSVMLTATEQQRKRNREEEGGEGEFA